MDNSQLQTAYASLVDSHQDHFKTPSPVPYLVLSDDLRHMFDWQVDELRDMGDGAWGSFSPVCRAPHTRISAGTFEWSSWCSAGVNQVPEVRGGGR